MEKRHPARSGLIITVLAATACTSNVSLPDAGVSKAQPDAEALDAATQPDAFPPPVPDDCLTDVSAEQHSFICEGISIEVSVPDACIDSACGIIFDIHGAYMTADDEEAHMNMRALGEAHGYIVVQPTAPAKQNGQPFWFEADVDALHRILRRVSAAWHADLRRIHFTGFSQGGNMSWFFACRYGHELAAVAPAAGAGGCMPSAQSHVLAMVGRNDPLITQQMFDEFSDELVVAWGLDPASRIADDGHYTRDRYSNTEGTVVEIIQHDYITDPAGALAANGGHCYPGSTATTGSAWDDLKCTPPNAFHWGEEAVEFFVAHPKQTVPDIRDGGVSDGPDAGEARPANWVIIPAGTFTMGSTTSEPCRVPVEGYEEDQHSVTLTHDFMMQSTEVTQGQFERLMGYNPSYFTGCGVDCPVEKVSWHDSVAYCNALSVEAGYDSCYTCNGSGSNVSCTEAATFSGSAIYSCPGYRLPTEAEWEYAYRAGTTTTAYYSGDNDPTACSGECPGIPDAHAESIGWYRANSEVSYAGCQTEPGCPCQGPHPVGEKQENAWGLHDMAGNVYEWCNDWFQDSLGFSTVTDPWGAPSESYRLLRGGAWHTGPAVLRAAMRLRAGQGMAQNGGRNAGFRCVRSVSSGDVEWIHSVPASSDLTKSEVTVAQFSQCVRAGACSNMFNDTNHDPFCNYGTTRDDHPMNCVDWHGAVAFCAWANGRLPTEDEWFAEASNGGQWTYPWGDTPAPSCDRVVMEEGGRGCGLNETWPVCSKPLGNSISDLCDMAGNLWEWTSTADGPKQVIRGGSLNNSNQETSYEASVDPTWRGLYIGFRCARP